MSHSGLAFKFLSEALRVGKGVSLRSLHDGARGLHNATENVVGMVADSMGRSRTKLSTGTEERHGITRVGPSTDVLQVTRSGTDVLGSGQEPAMEESRGFVMSDPNSSMWNLCKDRVEDAEVAASKIKRRISKMKEDIKHYYVERLEENQVLFAELEESFKIGKKNMGRKMLREEELEPVEVIVQAVHKPRKPIRHNSLSHMKQIENEDMEMLPEERSSKGYRRFSGANKKKSDERMAVWKRSQGKQDAKEGQEGFTDVGGMSPVGGHFRSCLSSSVGLLDSVPLLFRKPSFGGYRNYSSLTGQPTVLGRVDAAKMKNYFQTSSAANDCCIPNLLPPMCCPKTKLPRPPRFNCHCWPECEKITLCGCCPVHPRICCDRCICLTAELAVAKRPDYICPSFSECKRKTFMNKRPITECCDKLSRPKVCDHFVECYVPFVSSLDRQEKVLGRKYWTCCQGQCCNFHSSARRFAEGEEEEDCERKRKMPCHKPSPFPDMKKKDMSKIKGSCEKLCMPCCQPAIMPPECVSLYTKQPCKKFSNPRPSFSECKKKFPFKHIMCECEVAKKPLCKEKKEKKVC